MKEEIKSKSIEIKSKNIYLIKEVNYTEFKSLYEWECLQVSQNAYKFKDLISERVFWIEKENIKSSTFGQGGFFIVECLFDFQESLISSHLHKDRISKILSQKDFKNE